MSQVLGLHICQAVGMFLFDPTVQQPKDWSHDKYVTGHMTKCSSLPKLTCCWTQQPYTQSWQFLCCMDSIKLYFYLDCGIGYSCAQIAIDPINKFSFHPPPPSP